MFFLRAFFFKKYSLLVRQGPFQMLFYLIFFSAVFLKQIQENLAVLCWVGLLSSPPVRVRVCNLFGQRTYPPPRGLPTYQHWIFHDFLTEWMCYMCCFFVWVRLLVCCFFSLLKFDLFCCFVLFGCSLVCLLVRTCTTYIFICSFFSPICSDVCHELPLCRS